MNTMESFDNNFATDQTMIHHDNQKNQEEPIVPLSILSAKNSVVPIDSSTSDTEAAK